jgi:transcriptional regulator with XRE-family HTH domain
MKSEISKNIKKYRIEKGYTQKKLGELSGLHEVTIRQYEADKYKPKFDNLLKLSKALNISIDGLWSEI